MHIHQVSPEIAHSAGKETKSTLNRVADNEYICRLADRVHIQQVSRQRASSAGEQTGFTFSW